MEFITVEQFKEQPVEVQKVFLDWWQPEIGDLISYKTKAINNNWTTIDKWLTKCITEDDIFNYPSKTELIKSLSYINEHNYSDEIVPIFTEGQLRKFIENKTNGIVKLVQWHIHDSQVSKHGYAIDILRKNEYHVTYHYKDLGENLLQAYWQVACEIAKELFRVKYIKPYDNKH